MTLPPESNLEVKQRTAPPKDPMDQNQRSPAAPPVNIGSQIAGRRKGFGQLIGRLFSNRTYLERFLFSYFGASLVIWSWLAIDLGTLGGEAANIAYDIATGGNPLPYANDLQRQFPVLWVVILIFRIFSWLIIPVLAAGTVDAAYRDYEARRTQAEKRLKRIMRKEIMTLRSATGNKLDEHELEDVIEKSLEKLQQRKKRRWWKR